MDIFLKFFETAHIRDYKGGKEIRVSNLESSISLAEKLIKANNLNIEIIDRDPILKSFTVKEI